MAILVKDSFNRANSTTGLGQTDTGQTWQTFGSVWGIQNNQAYPISFNFATPPYIVTPKINNIAYEIKLSVYTSDFIVFWKCSDISNTYTLENGVVVKIVGGVVTVLSTFSSTLKSGDLIRIEIQDNTHTIFLNGSQIATFTDSSNSAGDKFGFTTYENTTVRYDDFLIEDLSSGTIHTKTLNETVSISENVTKKTSRFKTLSDSLAATDTISKRLSVIVADTIATSENENEQSNKAVSDSLSLTDNQSKTANKVILDNINLAESISERTERILSDFIPIDDNISIANSNTRSINLSDSIAILDSISKQLSRSISDNVSLGDTEDEKVLKSLVDNIALSDSISTFGDKSILLTDSIIVTDSISTTKKLSRLFTESINVSDSFTKQSAQSIKFYEVIVTADEIDVFNPDAPELVGVIHLQGKRELYVYLEGKRDLVVNLQGKRELFINLQGGLNMVPNQNFSMVSGDTTTLIVNINENLTGASVKWAMKKRGAPTVSLTKNGSIVDGKIHIILDAEDTDELSGLFVHECEITDQNGNVSTVTTGSVNILADMI